MSNDDGQLVLDSEQKPILDTDLINIGEEYKGETSLSIGFYVNFTDLDDRINAEYYHPKYNTMRAMFGNQDVVLSIATITNEINNGIDSSQLFNSGKREYVSTGTPYLRVGDVYENFIDRSNAEKVTLDPEVLDSRCVTKVNDVLITRKGTTGRSSVVIPSDEGAIISSEIIRLSLKENVVVSLEDGRSLTVTINPYYVSAFLNSKIGRLQIEQKRTGGISQGINHPDLKTVEIPILSEQEQNRIADLYIAARKYRMNAIGSDKTAIDSVEAALLQTSTYRLNSDICIMQSFLISTIECKTAKFHRQN
jgi:hypothetical protein